MSTAKQIMTCDPFTVTPETSVRDLADTLTEKSYSGAPVLGPDGELVGIVTSSDLIFQRKNLHLPTVFTIFDSVITLGGTHELDEQVSKMLGSTVADIMSTTLVTVSEEASLEDIATIMSEQGKHFIPVLRDDRLVGVIDRSDLVRAISKDR